MEKRRLSKKLLSYIFRLAMVLITINLLPITVYAKSGSDIPFEYGDYIIIMLSDYVDHGDGTFSCEGCDKVIFKNYDTVMYKDLSVGLYSCDKCVKNHGRFYVTTKTDMESLPPCPHCYNGKVCEAHKWEKCLSTPSVFEECPQPCKPDEEDFCEWYGLSLDVICKVCGGTSKNILHKHSKETYHEAVAATCVTGNVEYWDCACGGKIDASENVLSSTVVAATANHDFTNGVTKCKVCGGCKSVVDTGNHSFVSYDAGAVKKCSVCGKVEVTFSILGGNPMGNVYENEVYVNEEYDNLLDGKTDTKWCGDVDDTAYVVIEASVPISLSGYTITTGGDTKTFPKRNPKSWELFACNDYDAKKNSGTWKIIDTVSDGKMPKANKESKSFDISETEAYKYFKWNITSLVGDNTLQVSEFSLSYTVGNCARGKHDFSECISNGDGTHKVVCTACKDVQEGHDEDACTGGTATCEDKARCESCGEEYGELAAHTGGTATCKEKAKCESCGEEYGELAAHTGGTATCKEKAKCTVCGQEYGKLADHKHDATWISDGTNHWHVCTVCGEKQDEEAHTLKTTTTKATLTENGKKETKCSVCSKVTKTTKIYAAKTIELSKTVYAYDGKAKKPTVTVKDSKGNAIATANYSVKYDDGRKNVGKYNVKITFKGDYKGSKTLTFTINPKATTLKSVTSDSKAFTATWSKQTTQVDGYEIQYALDKNFTGSVKRVSVTKNTTTSKKISSLQAKKTYYVKVRTYKKVGTKKYYSDWSKVLNVKTK